MNRFSHLTNGTHKANTNGKKPIQIPHHTRGLRNDDRPGVIFLFMMKDLTEKFYQMADGDALRTAMTTIYNKLADIARAQYPSEFIDFEFGNAGARDTNQMKGLTQ